MDDDQDWNRFPTNEPEQDTYQDACDIAYRGIIQIGFIEWITKYTYKTIDFDLQKSKIDVINNLIEHYSSTEEYERCSYLKTNLDIYTTTLNKSKKSNDPTEDSFW